MNKFITFEGIDGCGKTTQIDLLSKYFNNCGKDCIIVREPGDTILSEKIRTILLDNRNSINKNSETLLFLASRSQLVTEIIETSIKKNKIILCDRFTDSTLAYQGYGRGIEINLLRKLNYFATNNLIPDLTFIFDINIKTALERLSYKKNDRMENSGYKFMSRVKNGYIKLAREEKHYHLIDCDNKDIETINNEVVSIISKVYGE